MTRRLPALLAAAALLALGAPAAAQGARDQPYNEVPEPVPLSATPPVGRSLSSERVLAIASALPKMRPLKREYRGSFADVYTKGATRWQVSFFTYNGKKEIGLVVLSGDGRVLEQWTGFQIAWTMARGYPGAFGEHVNALYVWLPLCVLFLVPFLRYRRPLSLHNLDLLALLSFSVSLAFFNHAHIYASVPLAYAPLLYLLARMLWLVRRRSRGTPGSAGARPLPLLIPAPWLAVAVVFLIGFRVGLNVTDSNVIDVGYAGVIGAQRITSDRPLYGGYPSDNEHGDTYGPFNYEAYVPFEQIFGWSGTWNDLPAAHAAAIFFDLLCVALLFLLGRRMRGPTLGVALAYAWVSFPFTLFALESNANDSLVAAMVLAALLAAGSGGGVRARSALGRRVRESRAALLRGVFAALAGFTKFAPLALAPILATQGMRQLPGARPWLRVRMLALYALGFAAATALAFVPALSHDSLHTIYERTLVYQANRDSPFSVWGLYGLHTGEVIVEALAIALAVALALVPRREDTVGLAAACAAILIAVELGMEHWFYLYIPWFFGLVMLALFGRYAAREDATEPAAGAASEPARSIARAAALST